MNDNPNSAKAPGKGHRFGVGHKYYPRKSVPAPDANEITALGITAVKRMLDIAQRGYIQEPGPKGGRTPVDVRQRLMLLRSAAACLAPKVPAIVQQPTEHRHAIVDLTRLMQDPKMVAAAEQLALGLLPPGDDVPKTLFDVPESDE